METDACLLDYNNNHRYTKFGGPIPTRPVEDIAFAVARFVQNNGSFFNYYMVRILCRF